MFGLQTFASQESTISRPDYDDILKRVSIVIYQHIRRGEQQVAGQIPWDASPAIQASNAPHSGGTGKQSVNSGSTNVQHEGIPSLDLHEKPWDEGTKGLCYSEGTEEDLADSDDSSIDPLDPWEDLTELYHRISSPPENALNEKTLIFDEEKYLESQVYVLSSHYPQVTNGWNVGALVSGILFFSSFSITVLGSFH